MTEAINFFQAMFIFKGFMPKTVVSKQEIKLAVWLKREAQNLATIAEQECQNGETAQNLALTATDAEKIRIFTEIAAWHYNRAAEKYRKSAEKFVEAGAIKTGKRWEFKFNALEMSHRAVNAESAVNLLNGLKNTK